MVFSKRLPELLERPFSVRIRRDIVMQELASAQFHDHEYIKDTESGCEHHEKVARRNRLGMIVHECHPPLTWIRRPNE